MIMAAVLGKIDPLIIEKIAIDAGKEILKIYNGSSPVEVTLKADNSPLTEADCAADALITRSLQDSFPDIPILSEESIGIDYTTRQTWDRYWLVDPLDGTKEFISRNGEFTVNIALIENGDPVLGVVHVPVLGVTYSGRVGGGDGAVKIDTQGIRRPISSAKMKSSKSSIRIVASRNHRGDQLDRLIDEITRSVGKTEVVSMGSSLKMCLVAEGRADFYPRLAPTCEWDTAAAHAILVAAGGQIVGLDFQPLRYNLKDSLLNPDFIAIADMGFDWQRVVNRVL
ncbi:MAG: 3'(2'), 5'-bisphosphate nucleotidase [Pseudohongiellaceae bacterium]|jgi:3'(2'), 5'-bisphosphate nucleotidase